MSLTSQTDPHDIQIWQGKTFALDLTHTETDGVTPIDLTGWTGGSQTRRYPGGAARELHGHN